MKICYGDSDETERFELNISGIPSEISEHINDLMQIYDLIIVFDSEGKDVTVEYC